MAEHDVDLPSHSIEHISLGASSKFMPPKWSNTNRRVSLLENSSYFEQNFTAGFSLENIECKLSKQKLLLKDEVCYALNDIFSSLTKLNPPEDDEKAGQTLVTTILNSDKHLDLEVHLTRDDEIECFKGLDVPGISSRVKPDLSVYNRSKKQYVSFIEVESETLISTIRKMYFILLLQLIRTRICDKSVCTVTGLVLPKWQKKSCVIAATVTWNSVSLGFSGSLTPICKSNLCKHVRKLITEQDIATFELVCPTNEVFYFQDCLSALEIEKYLSRHSVFIKTAHFFPSRNSIIVYADELVYKCPLVDNKLLFLLLTGTQHKQLSFPLGLKGGFFSFPLLYPPLDISSVQKCFSSFAISTLHALEALHEAGFAHLDVRLPNICFKEVNCEWHAVLIDLDHAVEIGRSPRCSSQKSVMYDVDFDDNRKYDWRQFSLLLSRVIEGSDHDYHTKLPVFQDSKEGRSLKSSFDFGTKPPLQSLSITLVDSPKSLNDLFILPL